MRGLEKFDKKREVSYIETEFTNIKLKPLTSTFC